MAPSIQAPSVTGASNQHNPREKGGTSRTDIGVGTHQPVLGGNHVRAVEKQIRGQSHGKFLCKTRFDLGQRLRLHPLGGADPQRQGIAGGIPPALQGCQVGPRRIQQGFRLNRVHFRAGPHLIAESHDPMGFLAAGQGGFGNGDQLVQLPLQQIGIGNLGNQADNDGAPRRIVAR